jgi:hypothetical protein
MSIIDYREPTSLFISHISEEADIAALLKQIVEADFAGQVSLFASSDIASIRGGENWLDAIRQGITKSAVVLVLCSHASVQRPWVQFEIGAAWMLGKTIVPICHSGLELHDVPMPLSALEGVELGTQQGLQKLYRSVADALKLRNAPELRDVATRLGQIQQLEQRFARSSVEQFERFFDVIIPSPGTLDAPIIPEDAVVESNADSLRLFELAPGGTRRWRDIVAAARQTPDQRWLEQLQHCIYLSSQNRIFRSVQAIYHCRGGAFQPQLSRKDSLADGASRFHVHLVETVVAPLFEVQNEFGMLATLLRLGLRFRYEVILRSGKLFAALPKNHALEDLQRIVLQLRDAVETIECDAMSRGAEHIDRASVADLFDDEADKEAIGEISDLWDGARARLFREDATLTLADLRQIFEEMRQVNFRFMTLGTRRFHEMVSTRWMPKPVAAGSGAITGSAVEPGTPLKAIERLSA